MRTRGKAAVDMIIQTRFFGFFTDVRRTKPHAERHVDHFQNVAHPHAAHIRTEIFASLFQFARNGKRGKLFGDRDFDIGIRFIVFEEDIVFRLVFFDEVVFKRERVDLRFGDDIMEIGDVLHHRHDLFRLYRGMKILTHSVFQIARLSHVDHVAVAIVHDIYARIVGQKF